MYSLVIFMSCFISLQITRVMYNQSCDVECSHFPLSLINSYFSPEDIFIYLNMCNQVKGEYDEWGVVRYYCNQT